MVGTASASRFAADAHFVYERAFLALAQATTMAAREELHDFRADVVLRSGVLRAGVAEPDHEEVGRRTGARR